MINAIDTALTARVDDLSSLIIDGSIPTILTAPGDDNSLVQVVDGTGTVIASSPNIAGENPLSDAQPAPGAQVVTTQALPIGEGDFRLIARTVPAHDQQFTVYAAADLQPVSEAVGALAAILAVGIPILIALVGVTVWIIVGRTLHPVEAIRGRVASISEQQLDRRVPVPDADDEIGRLARTMNDMLDRLEGSADQQRHFVADVSHELRSPLSAIRSQLEVDLAHQDRADWSTTSEEILDETLRMQRLVDDLLLLARSDTHTMPAIYDSVDLDDIVLDLSRKMQPSISIRIDTSRVSGAQIIGNPDQLTRLVRNLLENAARHADTVIRVALTEGDSAATLIISDDGPGIPIADRERAFDRFTRLDEARDRDHGGSGLGLSIAREITRHHGGTIMVDEDPLGGARFTVVIPMAPRYGETSNSASAGG